MMMAFGARREYSKNFRADTRAVIAAGQDPDGMVFAPPPLPSWETEEEKAEAINRSGNVARIPTAQESQALTGMRQLAATPFPKV